MMYHWISTLINGVKQGGILSPMPFALYDNQLPYILATSNDGCFLDDSCRNLLFYADEAIRDLCPIAPQDYKH